MFFPFFVVSCDVSVISFLPFRLVVLLMLFVYVVFCHYPSVRSLLLLSLLFIIVFGGDDGGGGGGGIAVDPVAVIIVIDVDLDVDTFYFRFCLSCVVLRRAYYKPNSKR